MDRNVCRVLVIDDVPAITRILELFLSRSGYRVRTVNDSREALQAVREFSPAVVLVDIAMPYMNGYEVARRIRVEEGFQEVPIIAITSFNDAVHLERAEQAGIDRSLLKPCNLVSVQDLVEKCCQTGHQAG